MSIDSAAHNDSEDMVRSDGALLEALTGAGNSRGSIANTATGLGTGRDPLVYAQPLQVVRLAPFDLESLYRSSRIIEKIVCLLPEAAGEKPINWSFDSDAIEPDAVTAYFDNIGLMPNLTEASIMGRLYGDGFLVLGINDGLDASQPVDEKKIKSIGWVRSLSCQEVDVRDHTTISPEQFYLRPNFVSEGLTQGQLIHKSRLLRFSGKKLYSESLRQNGGFHDSSIQACFNEFANNNQGLASAASMLVRHSVFMYKTKDLAKMTMQEDKTALQQRFTGLMMGLSTIKGLVLDLDREDAQFITQQYGGVDAILSKLEDSLIAASGLPRSYVMGSANVGAFSEAGQSDRYSWADIVSKYQQTVWKPELMRLLRYTLAAKDFGAPSKLPKYDIKFESALQLTRAEIAELKLKNAESDEKYINLRVLSPEEVRESRFASNLYNDEITLSKPPVASKQEVKPKVSENEKSTLNKLKEDVSVCYGVSVDRLDGLTTEQCQELLVRIS